MNFSSLSSNEKLAVFAAIAAIIGVLIASFLAGLAWITLIAGVAMLVLIFLPQLSSGTQLPGSKGSLMFLVGLIGGFAAAIALLTTVPTFGAYLGFYAIQTLFLLIGVAGGLVMAWTGWQEFQAEGGSFRLGSSGTAPSTSGGASRTDASAPSSASGASGVQPTGSSAPGSTSADTTGMGSTGAPSTSVGGTSAGSTDMGSEGGPVTRRDDDEGGLRNP